MKPILAIDITGLTDADEGQLTHALKHSELNKDYHVFMTDARLKLKVFNGPEIQEMTWEEFKESIK